MGEFDGGDKDFPAEDSINSLLNLNQFTAPPPRDDLDITAVLQNDFLDQMFSSLPPSTSFPWVDSYQPPVASLEDQQAPLSPVEAKALLLQQQFQLASGNAPMCHGDQNDVVDGVVSFPYPNLTNDASVTFNGFDASFPQNSIQSHHFNSPQSQNYGAQAVSLPISPPAAIGSSSGATAAQPRQRVRARRGQATDPHSIAERLRRERIAERMKALQELVPNSNKMDKATMLDEIIDYVKFLQLQVKVLNVSRLGGGSAASVAPSLPDYSHEGKGENEGVTVTEQQVAKLMEEDMGAAMQYLQGKGLCLMPISLATIVYASRQSSHFNGRAANSSSTVGDVSTIEDAAGC